MGATVLSSDVADCKNSVGTLHRDTGDLAPYMTMNVVEETFDEKEGVADSGLQASHRRHRQASEED